MPVLFILTGPNGAGKSTIGYSYLPEKIQKTHTVFDGDKLALQKRKELFTTINSIKEARNLADEWVQRQFLLQVDTALKAKTHFVYEGHFRDPQTLKIPRKFKRNGYALSLIFMGLSDPHLSELRVIDRAKYGGHFVPFYEVESNFYGNLIMLNKNFKLFDELLIVDTSASLSLTALLQIKNSKVIFYSPEDSLPLWFRRFLPNLVTLIRKAENFKNDLKY